MSRIAAEHVTEGLHLKDDYGAYVVLKVERHPAGTRDVGVWIGQTEEIRLTLRSSAGDELGLTVPPSWRFEQVCGRS